MEVVTKEPLEKAQEEQQKPLKLPATKNHSLTTCTKSRPRPKHNKRPTNPRIVNPNPSTGPAPNTGHIGHKPAGGFAMVHFPQGFDPRSVLKNWNKAHPK